VLSSKKPQVVEKKPQFFMPMTRRRGKKGGGQRKEALIAAVVARSVAPPVAAPALASGVFDPLDPLIEWCAELEAPIGLPGYATNNDSSSDSESAQSAPLCVDCLEEAKSS
jgi:hypothetical protein